ncbi:hypothetical protein Pelo_10238 [Pelomyxa schiedti]|nr:hypothetical protein Pelo_10238 [Pelomyxa schiedti]
MATMEVPPVKDECVTAFRQPGNLGVIFRLNGSNEVVVGGSFPLGTPYADFAAAFPADDVAWAILNVRYMTTDGGKRLKHCWLSWIPDDFHRATTKETVGVKFTSPMVLSKLRNQCAGDSKHGFSHHGINQASIALPEIIERATKFERDPVDPASVLAFGEGRQVY